LLNIFIFMQWIHITKWIHDSNTNTIWKCIIPGKNMQKPEQTRTNAKFHVTMNRLQVRNQWNCCQRKERNTSSQYIKH
jgi:hypothetical protein